MSQWCYSGVIVTSMVRKGQSALCSEGPPPSVFQWCCSGVTVVLRWCYGGVTVVFQWCYSGATVMLQWCDSK
jgi:hypothetical protein